MPDARRAAACAHVYRQFPALNGVRPSSQRAGPNLVFTFRRGDGAARGDPHPAMHQIVRVTVDEGGRIVRVVASR